MFFCILYILEIHILQQFLNTVACIIINCFIFGTDTQMKLFLWLNLLRSFLVSRSPTPKPQLQNLIGIIARSVNFFPSLIQCRFDNFLHIDALRTDNSTGYLKIFLVFDLDIVSAGVLALFHGLIAWRRWLSFEQCLGIWPFYLHMILREDVSEIAILLWHAPLYW